MIISSKFHDYYDSATSYGMDKSVVYQRITSEMPCSHKGFYDTNFRTHDNDSITVRRILIGFCGKIIPVVMAGRIADLGRCFYNAQGLIDYLEYNGVKIDKSRSYYFYDHMDSKKGINDFFSGDYTALIALFGGHNVPVFSITKREKITLNPSLKDLEFFRLMNPYACFQEIFGYISGVLGTPKEKPLEISDEVKLTKKGFFEWSFKKLPGGKKRGKNK